MWMLRAVVVWAAASLSSCNVAAPEQALGIEIGGLVQLLASSQGELADKALRGLIERNLGRSALPYLETALHRAPPAGRRNLVVAMRRLGLAEAAPLLGHVAAFDEDEATAREACRTLSLWASDRGKYAPFERGQAARSALGKVDEIRGMRILLLDP